MRLCIATALMILCAFAAQAQTDSTGYNPNWQYQIYLKKPAKEVKQLLNEKTCEPINGTISDGKQQIIMTGYPKGTRVYVRVIYEDGTEDEFSRSACFIDPVL